MLVAWPECNGRLPPPSAAFSILFLDDGMPNSAVVMIVFVVSHSNFCYLFVACNFFKAALAAK